MGKPNFSDDFKRDAVHQMNWEDADFAAVRCECRYTQEKRNAVHRQGGWAFSASVNVGADCVRPDIHWLR